MQPLTMTDYSRHWSCLLHLEELQMEIDIHQFDMINESLQPCGEYLSLTVPGLAEGRPSVLIGDKVVLTAPGAGDCSPSYEGYVHEVLREEVLLKFHQDFHTSYDGEPYNVFFMFNRSTLRRCHQAVNFAHNLGSQVLFPSQPTHSPPLVNCQLDRTNTKGNHSGTGKTVTLVEAILQVFHTLPYSRIIACTPSNSAADLLAERLHHSGQVKQADMVRLNAFQRVQEVPESIERYCMDGDQLEQVSRRRIIVATCSTAGLLYSLGLRAGHFTHVFVDEAGQATEPECLIPVGLCAGVQSQVVLAGDPMQLGPVLQSHLAKDLGLGQSLLERLMTRGPYLRDNNKFSQHGAYNPLLRGKQVWRPSANGYSSAIFHHLQHNQGHSFKLESTDILDREARWWQRGVKEAIYERMYNPTLNREGGLRVTKLVCNYRSHPALLKLPSELFYHGDLFTLADPSLTRQLENWEGLPCKGRPIIFHGTEGEDMREGSSPSWFNPVEAVQVLRYTQLLLGGCVKQSDLGIITPYRKQVEKLRLLLGSVGLDEVKVGSVEEFQGQERLIIIISTVRSTTNMLKHDTLHTLGFLSNPKRFNVSVTRAQALLIMVGNPHVLGQDPYWLSMLQYCVDQGAYTGCSLPSTVKVKSETNSSTGDVQHTEPSCPLPTNSPPSNPQDKPESQVTGTLTPDSVTDTRRSHLDRDRNLCSDSISNHKVNIQESGPRGDNLAHSEEKIEAKLGGGKTIERYDKNTSKQQQPVALTMENQVMGANGVKAGNKDSVVADSKSGQHVESSIKDVGVRKLKEEDKSSVSFLPEVPNTVVQNGSNMQGLLNNVAPILSVETMEDEGMNVESVYDCPGLTCQAVCDYSSMPSLSDGESDQHDSDVIVESS
ncbi:hypothetical protein Bbelb_186200 [Branchiostoma belcheri]|nr:hypothetical protein Bbelb_186200 [Branchiostoma belcheri]